jgi:hypothetical protein
LGRLLQTKKLKNWVCARKKNQDGSIRLSTIIHVKQQHQQHPLGSCVIHHQRSRQVHRAHEGCHVQMQKACKKKGMTTVEQLDILAKELLSSTPQAGLQLSSDGYSVKVLFKDEEELHSRLNQGFVVDGHGSPAQALQAICDLQGPRSPVQCVFIPEEARWALLDAQVHISACTLFHTPFVPPYVLESQCGYTPDRQACKR